MFVVYRKIESRDCVVVLVLFGGVEVEVFVGGVRLWWLVVTEVAQDTAMYASASTFYVIGR